MRESYLVYSCTCIYFFIAFYLTGVYVCVWEGRGGGGREGFEAQCAQVSVYILTKTKQTNKVDLKYNI